MLARSLKPWSFEAAFGYVWLLLLGATWRALAEEELLEQDALQFLNAEAFRIPVLQGYGLWMPTAPSSSR